jgi:dTDP-glucose pyrophosphorylase
MLEISLGQLKACGVADLCVIASEQTYKQIYSLLKESFLGMPVRCVRLPLMCAPVVCCR